MDPKPKAIMGRPPVPDELRKVTPTRTIRLSNAEWAKLKALGMDWLRGQIRKASVSSAITDTAPDT